MKRLELIDGKSSKYWEVQVDQVHVRSRYGRIGTAGNQQEKVFQTPELATQHAERMIKEKLAKGYKETNFDVSDASHVSGTERHQVERAKRVPSKNPKPHPKSVRSAPASRGSAASSSAAASKVQAQIDEAQRLSARILDYVAAHSELEDESVFRLSTPASIIRKRLHFLDESFYPTLSAASIESVNRIESMLSGPLFCSNRYPQPKAASGHWLFPILQVNLAWLSRCSSKDFGDGLLQLWFDGGSRKGADASFQGHIRVIPGDEVSEEKLVPFVFDGLVEAMSDSFLISNEWGFPSTTDVMQIVGLEPIGMTCPTISEYLGYIDEFDADAHERLLEDVIKLEGSFLGGGKSHFFGCFRPIQLEVEDFYPGKCFFHIADWGTGNADIHFLRDDNSKEIGFTFSHCPR